MKLYVEKIDSSLSFIEKFPKGRLCVCKVRDEGGFLRVLKIAPTNERSKFYRECVQKEKQALNVADGIYGVPRLIRDYSRKFFCHGGALLKEYFEGEEFSEKFKNNARIRREIEHIVHDLHLIKIANLDLKPRNIIVSSDGLSAKFIDLDCCDIHNEKSDSNYSFDKGKEFDKYNLDKLFS